MPLQEQERLRAEFSTAMFAYDAVWNVLRDRYIRNEHATEKELEIEQEARMRLIAARKALYEFEKGRGLIA